MKAGSWEEDGIFLSWASGFLITRQHHTTPQVSRSSSDSGAYSSHMSVQVQVCPVPFRVKEHPNKTFVQALEAFNRLLELYTTQRCHERKTSDYDKDGNASDSKIS